MLSRIVAEGGEEDEDVIVAGVVVLLFVPQVEVEGETVGGWVGGCTDG